MWWGCNVVVVPMLVDLGFTNYSYSYSPIIFFFSLFL